ncbi:MAG TPA: type II toxin-antitoxin system PemK/MazF family toxin [Candidatus Absconditabacterales bacterium]|nr:type II toxin-antitoxin system PemK/MazF family toxin [Candidatus Absconditabacterales bacterium]
MNYNKDFNGRNTDKQLVDKRPIIHGKVGQIWHCKMGTNVGSEIDGKAGYLRPILILAIMGNMILIAPTTTQKRNLPFFIPITSVDFGQDKDNNKINSYAILSQCKTIDSRRLIKHKYTINKDELKLIKKLLIDFINK